MVIPPAVREAIAAHAREEDPNESCGLLAVRGGVADRYLPAENEAASPYRFELKPRDPLDFFLEDEGFELGVVHSHLSSPPRPSRTDVENIGLWTGKLYVIYSVARDELEGWRIEQDGSIEPVPLRSP